MCFFFFKIAKFLILNIHMLLAFRQATKEQGLFQALSSQVS